MSYTPSAAAQAAAVLAGNNQATLATPITVWKNAIAGGNLAPAALIDAILSALGYQAQFDVGSASTTTSSTSFVNLISCSWTPPLTKNYLIHVDLSAYNNTVGGGIDFQLIVGGVTLSPLGSMRIVNNEANSHKRLSFRQLAAFAAGVATTIQLQWKVVSGTATQDSGDFNTFTITG